MVTAAVSRHSARISIPDINVAKTQASPNQCQLVWVSPGLCPVATSEMLHSALGLEAALSAKSKASVSQCPQISCERNSQRMQQGPEVMLRLTHTSWPWPIFDIVEKMCSASHLYPGSRRSFTVYILDELRKLTWQNNTFSILTQQTLTFFKRPVSNFNEKTFTRQFTDIKSWDQGRLFACCSRSCLGFLQVLQFSPTVQRHAGQI